MDLALILDVHILFYVQTNGDADIHDHNIVPVYILNIFCRVSLHHMYYSMLCHPENVRKIKLNRKKEIKLRQLQKQMRIRIKRRNESIYSLQIHVVH